MIPIAQDIANEIRLQRFGYAGCFLIVEGERADLKVYQRFVDSEACKIIPAYGKENAVGALKILEQDRLTGVLAIVDADFWRLEEQLPTSPNLIVTDTYDLETMILKSPALEKVLVEFGSAEKINRLIQKRRLSIREILLEIGRPIGYLRWISGQQNLSLKIKGVPFKPFVDQKKLTLDTTKLLRTVKNKSGRHDIPDQDLRNALEKVADPAHDSWDVCCGHDLVCILSLGLCGALGSNKSQDVRAEQLEKILRLAYESSHFFATELYQSLKAWQIANQPFRILPTS